MNKYLLYAVIVFSPLIYWVIDLWLTKVFDVVTNSQTGVSSIDAICFFSWLFCTCIALILLIRKHFN